MSYEARPEFDLQELVNEYGLGGVSSVSQAESCGPDDQPTILVAGFQDIPTTGKYESITPYISCQMREY